MGLTHYMLDDDSLHVSEGGYEVWMRIPWYRSLPLSSLLRLDVQVDGERADPAELLLEVNDATYSLSELRDKWQDFWFIQDQAHVKVVGKHKLIVGHPFDVSVRADFQIPYIMVGPETPLTQSVTVDRQLIAQEAA